MRLFAFLLIAGVSPSQGHSQIVHIQNCKMGGCTWQKLISHTIVREESNASLIRRILLNGYSDHSEDDEYPESYDVGVEIDWDKEPYKLLIFCAKHLPVVISNHNTQVLDFNEIYGYQYSDANSYIVACHNEPPFAWQNKNWASLNGYRDPIVSEVSEVPAIDLFNFLK